MFNGMHPAIHILRFKDVLGGKCLRNTASSTFLKSFHSTISSTWGEKLQDCIEGCQAARCEDSRKTWSKKGLAKPRESDLYITPCIPCASTTSTGLQISNKVMNGSRCKGTSERFRGRIPSTILQSSMVSTRGDLRCASWKWWLKV